MSLNETMAAFMADEAIFDGALPIKVRRYLEERMKMPKWLAIEIVSRAVEYKREATVCERAGHKRDVTTVADKETGYDEFHCKRAGTKARSPTIKALPEGLSFYLPDAQHKSPNISAQQETTKMRPSRRGPHWLDEIYTSPLFF